VCAWEQKNCEMNKCLSLVHLTSTIGPESSDSGQSNSRFQGRAYNVNDHGRSYIPWVAKMGVRESAKTVRRGQLRRRNENPEAWRRMRSGQKRRYYRQSQNNDRRKGRRWTPTEDARITAESRPSDRRLSKSLGRSMQAIQQRRVRLS
jgi:hypothetical protein